MSTRSRFQRGARPTFNCAVCDRRTRHVENTDSELCPECWELAGHDNHHNDNATVPTDSEMKYYESLVTKAEKKGGNAHFMRASNSYIWRNQ